MEGFACIGTAALDLQMGENRVQNLFCAIQLLKNNQHFNSIQLYIWEFFWVSKATISGEEKTEQVSRLQFTQKWEQGDFWGEEEDRKFPQLLLSAPPPSLKAEYALRSFTDLFCDQNNCKKSFCSLQPSHFPELKHLHQADGPCPAEEMLQHFLPSLVRRSMRGWGAADGWGAPGQCQRSHRWDWLRWERQTLC